MKKHLIFAVLLVVFFLISCNPYRPVRRLSMGKLAIGMTKQQVLQEMGNPLNVIGAKKFPDGLIEVWEYRRYGILGSSAPSEVYWLYFLNGNLDRWGRPGDWSKEADQIYELRFK